jgi:predicted Rossmann-fold nucleotide-binding protein
MMLKYSYAFIVMPGGFGTMDEFFSTLTLIQTKSITQFPMVLFGKEFYKPLMEAIELMKREGTISEADLSLVLFPDDFDEAMRHINVYLSSNYDIRKKRKHAWWLFEKRFIRSSS